MSAVGADEHPHEIIIVRHAHGDHDEAHHGGVWKIAFADFMTAMMCFFLVTWLISAANEQTKAAVASYFNPVKLIDRTVWPAVQDEYGRLRATPGAIAAVLAALGLGGLAAARRRRPARPRLLGVVVPRRVRRRMERRSRLDRLLRR